MTVLRGVLRWVLTTFLSSGQKYPGPMCRGVPEKFVAVFQADNSSIEHQLLVAEKKRVATVYLVPTNSVSWRSSPSLPREKFVDRMYPTKNCPLSPFHRTKKSSAQHIKSVAQRQKMSHVSSFNDSRRTVQLAAVANKTRGRSKLGARRTGLQDLIQVGTVKEHNMYSIQLCWLSTTS